MPDLLTHYAISYLIASRITKPKQALFIALVGLLPDIDALLRIHRWITHSLVLVVMASFIVIFVSVFTISNKFVYYIVSLSVLLYILHVILDVFTGPTPLLWPLTRDSYMISISINGAIGGDTLNINPVITTTATASNFIQQQTLYGPIATEYSFITSIAVLTTILWSD